MSIPGSPALILGASGFLGEAFARHLQAAGEPAACLIHRSPLPAEIRPVRLYHGSLLTFPWRILEADPPRAIIHFARLSAPSAAGRRLAAQASTMANRRLLAWLERLAQPPRLVLIAGTLAYGPSTDEEIYEDHALHPAGFAREYARGEAPILAAMAAGRLPVQVMRPAWVYGARSWLRGFFFTPMLRQGHVPLYGEGDNRMALIHVEDAAALIDFLSREAPAGESYNLLCGAPLRQAELAETLSRISGLPIKRITRRDFPSRDRGVWESLTFSQRTASRHAGLYQRHGFRHPDAGAALASLWRSFINTPSA